MAPITIQSDPELVLFPNRYELADLVLSEMRLPNSSEQSGAQFQASLRGHYAFCTGDVKATKAADYEASIYGEINPLKDIKLLYQKEQEKVIDALTRVTKRHDNALRELQTRFPRLKEIMWQVFRRTLHVNSFTAKYALELTPEKIEELKRETRKYVIIKTTDEDFAKGYIPSYEENILKTNPNYRFIEFDKDYLLGIGRYAFANPEGDIFQTLWDIRQEEPQFFNYPKK